MKMSVITFEPSPQCVSTSPTSDSWIASAVISFPSAYAP
jgi:hypothetical protein